MGENTIAIISCIIAALSLLGVILFTGLQLSRKIVDAFKIEILRLFYSEPTASMFQWCRKISDFNILPIFSEIKGFFPPHLRWKYCERYFACALAEVKNELDEKTYSKGINYDQSMSNQRKYIFKLMEDHEKEVRAAVRGEDFHDVHNFLDKYYQELCKALIDGVQREN